MSCKSIQGKYCTLKARGGFCKRHLMQCGDDSILPIDTTPKIKTLLKQIIASENEEFQEVEKVGGEIIFRYKDPQTSILEFNNKKEVESKNED